MKISEISKTEFDQSEERLESIRALEDFAPILVCEGKILDGHHRFAVCLERGLSEIATVSISEKEMSELSSQFDIYEIYAAAYFVAGEIDQANNFVGEFGESVNFECVTALEGMREA